MNGPVLEDLPFLRSLCWQGSVPSIARRGGNGDSGASAEVLLLVSQ